MDQDLILQNKFRLLHLRFAEIRAIKEAKKSYGFLKQIG